MVGIVTFPSDFELRYMAGQAPKYMRPNTVPFAVILEGVLTDTECDQIALIGRENFPGYKHEDCGAITRALGHADFLYPIWHITTRINDMYFGYDVDNLSHSWLQSYDPGMEYQLHTDAAPGRMRKLTSVTLLNDPSEYEGGDLEIFFHPHSIVVPRTKGTIVVFQPMLLHKVHKVTHGFRYSLNMGFHGPNFR